MADDSTDEDDKIEPDVGVTKPETERVFETQEISDASECDEERSAGEEGHLEENDDGPTPPGPKTAADIESMGNTQSSQAAAQTPAVNEKIKEVAVTAVNRGKSAATRRILAINGTTYFVSRGMEKTFGFKRTWAIER